MRDLTIPETDGWLTLKYLGLRNLIPDGKGREYRSILDLPKISQTTKYINFVTHYQSEVVRYEPDRTGWYRGTLESGWYQSLGAENQFDVTLYELTKYGYLEFGSKTSS